MDDRRRGFAALREHVDEPGYRVHRRAVAEHDIDKQDRRRRVGRFPGEPLVAQAGVDHRVRAALRELVVAHVDDRVLGLVAMSSSMGLPATGVLDHASRPARGG